MRAGTLKYLLPLTFILVFLIYLQAADGPYIVDDMPNLVNNDKLIITEFSFEAIKEAALSSPASRFHRPISMLTFAANYSLTGDKSPFPVKLTNIILHLVIGLGIFILTRRLLPHLMQQATGADRRVVNIVSLLTTILWLSHPLYVSTVLYPVQRMAMLSAFFVIYGCVIYLYLRDRILSDNRGYITLLIIIPLITITGFFAKENAFLLPGFMLLIEYYCFNFRMHEKAPLHFITILKLFLWIPVVFVFVYLLYRYFNQLGAEIANHTFNINERILTQARILWHYLGWIVYMNPEPMGIYHDDIPTSISIVQPITTMLSIIAWITLIIAALLLNKYSKLFSFSLLWFFWGHSIESTVLPLVMVFEHRNYLPGYGPVLAMAGLAGILLNKHHTKKLLVYLLLFVLCVIPPILLHERVQRWTNPQSFGIWLVSAHPGSVSALATAANYLSAAGDIKNSIKALEKAKALSPENNSILFNMIQTLCKNVPKKRFNDQLVNTINAMPINKITATSRYYYNELVNNCTDSTINHDSLLTLYDRYSQSSDRKIAILSLYGRGKIYLYRNDIKNAVLEWEKAIESGPEAQTLIPSVRKLREILHENSPEANGSKSIINRP